MSGGAFDYKQWYVDGKKVCPTAQNARRNAVRYGRPLA